MLTKEKRREWFLAKPEEFWLLRSRSGGFRRVEGQPVQIDGLGEADLFLYQGLGGWAVADGVTGACLNNYDNESYESPEAACKEATEIVKRYATPREYRDRAVQLVEKSGLSPRYEWCPNWEEE